MTQSFFLSSHQSTVVVGLPPCWKVHPAIVVRDKRLKSDQVSPSRFRRMTEHPSKLISDSLGLRPRPSRKAVPLSGAKQHDQQQQLPKPDLRNERFSRELNHRVYNFPFRPGSADFSKYPRPCATGQADGELSTGITGSSLGIN